MGTLTHREARRVYDRIGSRQDSQWFYEDPATLRILAHGDFKAAQSVFEFGCGTGRFAATLLADSLPQTAHYRGVDVSPKMVQLARTRVEPYAGRAEVLLVEGGPPREEPDGGHDRFVSNYVFDLLSHEDIRAVLQDAHRMLRPGGLLCLSGLSTGVGPASRFVARMVGWIQSLRPSLVGGCRPVDLLPFLPADQWNVLHHSKVVAFGITSEAVVVRKRSA
jgi:SAM-dependent methyltransferase